MALSVLLTVTALCVGLLHISDVLYKADVKVLNLTAITGMSEEEIMDNYNAVMEYLSPFNIDEFDLPTLTFSESGAYHFYETRKIFRGLYMLGTLSLVVLTLLVMYLKEKGKLKDIIGLSGLMTLVIPIGVLSLVAADFNRAFILFHKLFFNNDMWIFDPVLDPIIEILPWQFFMHCAVFIGLMWILSAVAQLAVYFKMKKGVFDEKD